MCIYLQYTYNYKNRLGFSIKASVSLNLDTATYEIICVSRVSYLKHKNIVNYGKACSSFVNVCLQILHELIHTWHKN
jgi:hypothetical protein